MNGPGAPEVILELLLARAINATQARQYYRNYKDFQALRPQIEAQHLGEWVAVVRGSVIVAPTLRDLNRRLAALPNGDRAYAEHVGGSI